MILAQSAEPKIDDVIVAISGIATNLNSGSMQELSLGGPGISPKSVKVFCWTGQKSESTDNKKMYSAIQLEYINIQNDKRAELSAQRV